MTYELTNDENSGTREIYLFRWDLAVVEAPTLCPLRTLIRLSVTYGLK